MGQQTTSVDRFNALDGYRVKKKTLLQIKEQALREGQDLVLEAIENSLRQKPGLLGRYSVDIKSPLRWKEPVKKKEDVKEKKSTGHATKGLNKGLKAANPKDISKEALTQRGRLKPGYRYIKGGSIIKNERPKMERRWEGLLLFQMKPVSTLSKKEIAQVMGEYGTQDQWPSQVTGYIGAVKRELNKRKRLKKKTRDKPKRNIFSEKGVASPVPVELVGQKNVVYEIVGDADMSLSPSFQVPSPQEPLSAGGPMDKSINREMSDPMGSDTKNNGHDIVIRPSAKPKKTKKHGLVSKMSDLDKGPRENFRTSGDLGRFLGQIEIKPEESVVCTLDAPQGGGKTRLFFQLIKMFLDNGYSGSILFISLEEHPKSSLFTGKRDIYLPKEYHDRVDTVGKLPNPQKTLKELIPHYDIVFVDSWGKVADIDRDLDLDRDIRSAYDGKLFFVIFQRTSQGSMRGGSRAQFDADMVMKVEKDVFDYRNNYAYWDKNRYSSEPGLRYNIFRQQVLEDLPQGESDIKVELV